MSHRCTILYPADFFDLKKVDEDYEYEYREAVQFPEFQILFYNYDEFAAGEKLRFYPGDFEGGLCVYRGWMLQPSAYEELYRTLAGRGLRLINTPDEYENCHEFPNSYDLLQTFTPGMMAYPMGEAVDWRAVKERFGRFMMKDYVKSVKGSDFPVYFDHTYTDEEMDRYAAEFIRLRDRLFVKGIVLKEFVDLKKTDHATNEYRAFYLYGKRITLSKNSNQKREVPVPEAFAGQLPRLNSNFYTVDFAELADGSWIVVETGDGQVSGLSPGQYVFKFYEELLRGIVEEGTEGWE